MIAIWYVLTSDRYYAKYVKGAYFCSHYEVGYINQYGHKLVALFYIENKKLVSCNSINDYYNTKRLTFKQRIINRLIDLLRKI